MQRFLLGHSTHPDWNQAVRECLEQIGPTPTEATLGFVYVTTGFAADLSRILTQLRSRSGVPHWTGTVGIGICCTRHEFYERPAVAVMLTDFSPDNFRVFSGIEQDLQAFGRKHGDWCDRNSQHVAIVHGDPRNNRTPMLIRDLAEDLSDGYLIGGITSAEDSYPQVADSIVEGGLSGVIFNQEIGVVSGLTQGCTPIGPRHVISESERNIAVRLDGRPALEVFNEDIGEILARDLNRVAGYIFAALPITGSDTGDYLVRNLIGVDTQNQLLGVGENLLQGSQIMFCRRDGQSAHEDMQRMLDDIAERLAGRPIRGGVYYSCLGRGRYLFGDESAELKLISDALGDFPLIGFFANGEISHRRLYGYTGVLTLFV